MLGSVYSNLLVVLSAFPNLLFYSIFFPRIPKKSHPAFPNNISFYRRLLNSFFKCILFIFLWILYIASKISRSFQQLIKHSVPSSGWLWNPVAQTAKWEWIFPAALVPWTYFYWKICAITRSSDDQQLFLSLKSGLLNSHLCLAHITSLPTRARMVPLFTAHCTVSHMPFSLPMTDWQYFI